ncbi:hypothetical protein [Herbidospora daliensis]|uniref:hypothetical protein n=1 Tax=Herbidospora daliensis TaxID=295585 RepID=UPI000B054800|nr:hypothetical protein [Herbidospora daliensis]
MSVEVHPPDGAFGGRAWQRELVAFRGGVLRSPGPDHDVDLGYPVRLLTVRPDRLLHGRAEPEVVFL